MFKRIGLLILANLAIFIMLSVILTVIQMVFGINFGTMSGKSLNLGTLFVFAMVVGFSGSIISLLMSKTMAKMSMGLQMIDVNNPQTPVERYLVDVVRSEAQKAGLPMPEVGIYDGEPNAFATGASRSSSLVAVSTGLLNLMNREEVEAVLAHELSHVKNGDMVTMTLLQGVMNTFVVFLSRIIGWVVDRQILRNEDDAPGVGYYVTSLVLDICLGFLDGCRRFQPLSRIPRGRGGCGHHGLHHADDQRSAAPGRHCTQRASWQRQGLRHFGRHWFALREPPLDRRPRGCPSRAPLYERAVIFMRS